jgi:N-acyl-D-amino-acid deacylase
MLDILIRNAWIIDGSGAPEFIGSIGVESGRIVFVSKGTREADAIKTIDGTGLFVCPGFIDAHSHVDLTLDSDRATDNFLMQGITTSVGGHCGTGYAPVGETDYVKKIADDWNCTLRWSTFGNWMDHIESLGGTGINYVSLVPHNSLRGAVLGSKFTRESTPAEIEKITALLREALDAGAFGMSASLDAGVPGHFAGKTEILELLRLLTEYDAVFAPHTRHHQNQWPSNGPEETAYGLYNGPQGETVTGRYHGLLEVLEYAMAVPGTNLMISHLTPLYLVPHPHPAYVDDAIRRATLEEIIDRPSAQGVRVSFNALTLPYSISFEMNIADAFRPARMILPEWLRGLSREAFIRKLEDTAYREKLTGFLISGRFKFDMVCPATDPYWCKEFVIQHCRNKAVEGRTPYELALEKSPHDRAEALYHTVFEILYDIIRDDPAATWHFIEDRRVDIGQLVHPMGMVATDVCGFPGKFPEGRPQPGEKVSVCAYNSVPYYLEKLVKTDRAISLFEAVRKLSSLPADILGIKERGRLQTGYWADITIIDWDNFKTSHDFDAPATPTRGMEYVIVNGRIAYEKGELTKVCSGKLLRKKH